MPKTGRPSQLRTNSSGENHLRPQNSLTRHKTVGTPRLAKQHTRTAPRCSNLTSLDAHAPSATRKTKTGARTTLPTVPISWMRPKNSPLSLFRGVLRRVWIRRRFVLERGGQAAFQFVASAGPRWLAQTRPSSGAADRPFGLRGPLGAWGTRRDTFTLRGDRRRPVGVNSLVGSENEDAFR